MARKVDIENAIILKQAGKSYREIAKAMNTSKSNVHKQIAPLLPSEVTDEYKNRRADIFAEMQRKLLNHVDGDRLKKAPAGTLILAACQMYDKERLERGQSTSNQAIIHADIQSLKAMSQSKTGIEDEVIDIDSDD